MLSRSAQGVYWMGRYLERTEHLCRLLEIHVRNMVDRPVEEIRLSWRQIYDSLALERQDTLEAGDGEKTVIAASYILADELTFDPRNPSSVWNCFAMGRENARQMRHCISTEMWISLNRAYLKAKRLRIEDIWKASPESFYATLAGAINAFSGISEVTMYRDEGWSFLRLGHALERVQLSASLLLAQTAVDADLEQPFEGGWDSILRVHQARDAYSRAHGIRILPDRTLDLLATDPSLPRSILFQLEAAREQLGAIGPAPEPRSGERARDLAGLTHSLVAHQWHAREDRAQALREVRGHAQELHDLLSSAYFDYPVEDSPGA